MNIKFGKVEFEEFKKHVKHYIDVYNLHEYSIAFSHENIGDAVARLHYDIDAMHAVFMLSISHKNILPLTKNIEQIALEEVLHLLLARLSQTLVDAKRVDDWHVEAEEHAIINKITRAHEH